MKNENQDSLNTFADQFGRLIQHNDEMSHLAEAFIKSPRKRSYQKAVITCPVRDCVLAYIYETVSGIIVHHPPYRLSPTVNAEQSNASGRKHNTTDGQNHWKMRTYFLSQAWNLTLNCDHVLNRIVSTEFVEDLASSACGTYKLTED